MAGGGGTSGRSMAERRCALGLLYRHNATRPIQAGAPCCVMAVDPAVEREIGRLAVAQKGDVTWSSLSPRDTRARRSRRESRAETSAAFSGVCTPSGSTGSEPSTLARSGLNRTRPLSSRARTLIHFAADASTKERERGLAEARALGLINDRELIRALERVPANCRGVASVGSLLGRQTGRAHVSISLKPVLIRELPLAGPGLGGRRISCDPGHVAPA